MSFIPALPIRVASWSCFADPQISIARPRTRLAPSSRHAPTACAELAPAPPTVRTTFRSEYSGKIPEWLLARLDELDLREPTPIQCRSLPLSLGAVPSEIGKDVVLHAETGSGKTLAYLLPILSALQPTRNAVQAVVLVPTPELCAQVAAIARRLASASPVDLPILSLQEGTHPRRQAQQLRACAPRVVVGSVRAIKSLADSRRLRLDLVRVLVVDEFDAILADNAAVAALHAVLAPRERAEERQTLLASATVPQHRHFLRACVTQRWTHPSIAHVAVTEERRVPEALEHYYALCVRGRKLAALRALLAAHLSDDSNAPSSDADTGVDEGTPTRCIVFISRTRDALELASALESSLGSPVVGADEHLPDGARREALARFRSGDARVLISTDLAARGLDVPGVTAVYQLDLPSNADRYLHRAGRSARAGNAGSSVLLVEQGERFVLERLANSLDVEFERIRKSGAAGS